MSIREPLIVGGLRVDDNLLEPVTGPTCAPGACGAACCVGGIWVDLLAVQRILDHADDIRPFMAPTYAADEDLWFADVDHAHADFPSGVALETTIAPRVATPGEDGCIFLDDHHLCAIELASNHLGLPWPGLKPLECALYPLRQADGVLAYDETTTAEHPGATCQRPGQAGVTGARHEVFRRSVELAIGRAGWLALDARKR